MNSKRNALPRILIASFMIGLVVGAAGAYLIFQTQLAQVTSEFEKERSPRLPAFTPVTLDPKSTVLLLLDFTPTICYRRSMCNVTLPNVQALLSKARSAGVPIVYTKFPVRELQNRTGEAVITNDRGPDKFYGTVLDTWISDKQAKTVVIAGIVTNGAVLYTAFAAALRGYTVVVATDATVSDSGYIQSYTLFQLLNQPGRSNAENKPLAPNAVTLSTVPLIQFGS
ncbi:MAG TPA: isochorismatase family cysteine hydrolase [Candidatus Bathyarchaeia archaeon]|nr:isochorismatase family cysteine hydrolase [Candidatus Bathyarchaeia archaeon]